MIVCPHCQHRNPTGAHECSSCGSPLDDVQRACPLCGALNDASSLYCHHCLCSLEPVRDQALDAEPLPEAQSPLPENESTTEAAATPTSPAKELDAGPSADDLAPAFLIPEQTQSAQAPEPITPVDQDKELAWLGDHQAGPHIDERESTETVDRGQNEPEIDQESPDADTQPVAPQVPPTSMVQVSDAELVKPQILASFKDLQHAIPIETAMAMPHRAKRVEPDAPPGIEQDDASLFERIATEPASLAVPAHALITNQRSTGSRWTTVLLNLLVLAVAVLPLFTGGITAPWLKPRPSIVSAANAIASIPAGESVLIAFDYTPAYAGEMNPLAMAVLRQLSSQSRQLVAMSTEPAGVAIADQLLGTVAREATDPTQSQEWLNLGYLSGETAGLRSLSDQSRMTIGLAPATQGALPGQNASGDTPDLKSIKHVVILAEESRDVQNWIEQVQADAEWSLYAFAPSRVTPMLMPYLDSGQLESIVGGADGVAEYEIAANVTRSPPHRADGQAMIVVLVILVAILANAYAIVMGSRRATGRNRA